MKPRRQSFLRCFLRWLKRFLRRLTSPWRRRRPHPASSQTSPPASFTATTTQTVRGDGNQVIGSMSGKAKAIGHVSGDAYIDSTILQLPALPDPHPSGTPQNLPRSGTKAFVGRDTDLTALHTLIQQSDRVAITAIKGMGGIGKTELALQYAQHHLQHDTYPGGVCWFSVRDLDLGTQITNFARIWFNLTPPDDLDLAAQVQYCWQRWREGEVLIVLDDVTDYSRIKPYLPPGSPRFKVLLTTRDYLGQSFRPFEIEVLNEAAALDLLRVLTCPERIDAQLSEAQHLCHWLGYLPLGLEMVGGYLAQHPDLPLATLQQRLDAKRLQAKALCQSQPDATAVHASVAAAFELSWADLSKPEQHLARILSLYALGPIPWDLITSWFEQEDPEELEDWRVGLVNRSLLQRISDNTFQLHQLIREFFRAKLTPLTSASVREAETDLPTVYCQRMAQIAQQVPEILTRDNILTLTPLIPHCAEAATTWRSAIADEDLCWSFTGLARFYKEQGAYAQAEPWYEECVRVCRDRLGDEHPDVASSLNNLAGLYESQGRYGEAEPLYQQALALRQRLLGDEHPDVASSLNNLAGLYRSQGRYGEAEPLYLQALSIWHSRLGVDHPHTQTGFRNFVELLCQANAAGCIAELSDHPTTQALLQEILSSPS